MAYSNATFYMDYEGGSDSARTALTSVAVANNGSGLVRCTKAAHGLVTGAVVDLTLNYAGAWMVTRIDANNFDLVGSTYSTATACTVTPRGGSSKADAWKTITSGATSARIAPGDTIRLMASPEPTLVGAATWNQYSRTVTLASAVTANICDCESVWTGSANVTVTTDTFAPREGTKNMKAVIAAAFTTGKVAYFATGTLDLSAYQQVSFMFSTGVTSVPAGSLSLRLCSDTLGATTVHTIPIPALPVGYWLPLVVDFGTALNSSIQSIALYQDTDIPAITVYVDNVIACKASSAADSLTHQSLIGKASTLSWVASTAYAVGDGRKPTSPNRNGFRYVVTVAGTSGASEPMWPQEYGVTVVDGTVTWSCVDLEESWHAVQAINGTAIGLDGAGPLNAGGFSLRGYDGSTETVATFKRESLKLSSIPALTSTIINQFALSGTSAAPITYSGGWNRTDMTTQPGETWFDPLNGNGWFFYNNAISYVVVENINSVRSAVGYYSATVPGFGCILKNIHLNYTSGTAFFPNGSNTSSFATKFIGYQSNGCTTGAASNANAKYIFRAVRINGAGSLIVSSTGSSVSLEGSYLSLKNSGGYAINTSVGDINIKNLVTGNNASGVINMNALTSVNLFNALMPEATPLVVSTITKDRYCYSQNNNQTPGSHLIATDGGTIVSATDQRHTASGISWKFRPTSTNRGNGYPLRLSMAKIACTAGVAVSVQIWTRRDSTDINGTLKIAGGQIAGVGADVTVTCAPTINTWVQSSALTFTPTETGVVEITFEVYDGVGITNNFWIDDLSIG